MIPTALKNIYLLSKAIKANIYFEFSTDLEQLRLTHFLSNTTTELLYNFSGIILSSFLSNNFLKVDVNLWAGIMILKSKSENFKNSKDIALNYCENSSIHGIKYITNNKSRTLPERALWILLLLVSFFLCGYLIARIDKKRCDSPVMVSFNEAPIPIWQVFYLIFDVDNNCKSFNVAVDPFPSNNYLS